MLTLLWALCNQIKDKTPLAPWDGISAGKEEEEEGGEMGSASFALCTPSSPQAPVPGSHSRSKLCSPEPAWVLG